MKYGVGVDLGGSHIAAGVIAENGEVLSFVREDVEQKSAWAVTRKIGKLVSRMSEECEVPLSCVGLGIPGLVNVKEGLVHQSPHFPMWKNTPLTKLLANQLDLPFIFHNDANMFAYAELCCGVGKQSSDFIVLTLGSGIGGGIILDRQLITGSLGFAGEVGHMTIDEHGPRCSCGNNGCWELYAASQAFTQYLKALPSAAQQFSSSTLSLEQLATLAAQGNAAALQFWKWYGNKLALGMHALMNVFGVIHFVLSGSVAQAKQYFLEETLLQLQKRAYEYYVKKIKIETTNLTHQGGVVGSALFALHHDDHLVKPAKSSSCSTS